MKNGMDTRFVGSVREAVRLCAIFSLGLSYAATANAQCETCCCSPGTLFQWSIGNSFSGGPNLDEPLITDRPDFTESSSTVGRGVAQLELGYTYAYDTENGQGTRDQSIGQPLLRYGIFAEWLEFRIGLAPVEQQVAGSPSDQGIEDMYLGFKIGLTPQEGIRPEMALIPQATVPTGTGGFEGDEMLPGVNWVYSWEINDWLGIAGSSQGNRALDEVTNESYWEFAQSVTAAFGLTDELGFYTEWYAFFPSSADTARVEHYLNGGFTYLINNDVQFDISAGVGMNEAASDYFLGTGLSIRFAGLGCRCQ